MRSIRSTGEEPAAEMLALRVPLHFVLRVGTRCWSLVHPDGPLLHKGPLLAAVVVGGDLVQGLLLARGRLNGRRARVLRAVVDTIDVATITYVAGSNRTNPAADGAQLIAIPAVIERAYQRGLAAGVFACLSPVVGAVMGHLVARDRRARLSLLLWPGLAAGAGWALRVFEGWELRRREQAEQLWRAAVEDDAFTAGRLEFIRRDSEGGQLLDLQGHAVNFLANVEGGRREVAGGPGPKEAKAAPPPGIPRAALLGGALHLHQRRRQPLRPSPADTLIPQVPDGDHLALLDGEQLRRLEEVLLEHRPAGVTTASVVDRRFLGQGTAYRIRIRAPRSLDDGPPVDVEIDLPTSHRWRFEPVAFGLVLQAAYVMTSSDPEGDHVPFSVTLPTAAALLLEASASGWLTRRQGGTQTPLLSLTGFGPALVMATSGTRRMRRTHSPGGSPHHPGLISLVPLSMAMGYQAPRMRVVELCATAALAGMTLWLSWRNAPPPRNLPTFAGNLIWPGLGLAGAPFLRRAFDTRGERHAAGLNAVTSAAAERGRTRGWQAMVDDAWRFQEEAERLAEQARPADDYQLAFLEKARAKLTGSRGLLLTLGNPG